MNSFPRTNNNKVSEVRLKISLKAKTINAAADGVAGRSLGMQCR